MRASSRDRKCGCRGCILKPRAIVGLAAGTSRDPRRSHPIDADEYPRDLLPDTRRAKAKRPGAAKQPATRWICPEELQSSRVGQCVENPFAPVVPQQAG